MLLNLPLLGIRFNSTLVRLEAAPSARHGTSKNGFNSTLVRLEDLDRATQTAYQHSFNSTLVRLEAGMTQTTEKPRSSFNSTLVRLEAIAGISPKKQSYLFQFHAGSIRGSRQRRGWCFRLRFQFHAGSIRGQNPEALPFPQNGFNSTLVRLEVPKCDMIEISQSRFNSTLVRLEDRD